MRKAWIELFCSSRNAFKKVKHLLDHPDFIDATEPNPRLLGGWNAVVVLAPELESQKFVVIRQHARWSVGRAAHLSLELNLLNDAVV